MSKARDKGTRYESEIVGLLQRAGFVNAERKALHGTRDEGDITGIPGWTIEAKNHRELRLGEWLDELRVEMLNGNTKFGALVVKRRQRGAMGSYAVLPMETLLRLMEVALA